MPAREATLIRRNDLAGEVKGDGAFGWYTAAATAAEAVGNVGHVAGCSAGEAPPVAVGECASHDYDELERWTRVGSERGSGHARASGELGARVAPLILPLGVAT